MYCLHDHSSLIRSVQKLLSQNTSLLEYISRSKNDATLGAFRGSWSGQRTPSILQVAKLVERARVYILGNAACLDQYRHHDNIGDDRYHYYE